MPEQPGLGFEPSAERSIAFTVLGKPQTKLRPRSSTITDGQGNVRLSRSGRPLIVTRTPEKTRQAEHDFLTQALNHRPARPIGCGVAVKLTFFMPVPKSMRKADKVLADQGALKHTKRPDLDNLVKMSIDALTGKFGWMTRRYTIYVREERMGTRRGRR